MQPRLLWFLILSYVMVIIFSNWFDLRLIHLFGLTTDVGTLIFPLTFIFADLITEVYGYKKARLAIWCGFLFNFIFVAFGLLVTMLPSPDFAVHNDMFDELMVFNTRIVLAGMVSYIIAEPINSMMVAKLKVKMQGKHMGVRFVLSTFVASGIDSFIFATIAFYHIMPADKFILFAFTMWFIKVAIEILGLPIAIKAAKKLKDYENIDVYDTDTQYGIFSLDADYQRSTHK